MLLKPLPLPFGAAVLDSMPALTAILNGSAAYYPVPAARNSTSSHPVPANPAPANPVSTNPEVAALTTAFGGNCEITDGISLVIATSGTTGVPKGAQHTPATLTASIQATDDFLGGPGSWLLALPPYHIAGLQVLLRSAVAGTTPAIVDLSNGFDLSQFCRAAALLTGRKYISLVPGQLMKILNHPEASAALAEFHAVLVGGAATDKTTAELALASRIKLIRTYGMSETAGGCVYNGIPLAGVDLSLTGGTVSITGPMVAHGYRNRKTAEFTINPNGDNTFHTSDIGIFENNQLAIIGRSDEAINSGGLKVVPQILEELLRADARIVDVAVFPLPDKKLGEAISVAVQANQQLALHDIVEILTDKVPATSLPRHLFLVSELPQRGPGKVDRRALTAKFSN